LLALFHTSLLLLTLSAPATGGSLLCRSRILNWPHRLVTEYDDLVETNLALTMLEQKALMVLGEIDPQTPYRRIGEE
jgi:hypothetical protein